MQDIVGQSNHTKNLLILSFLRHYAMPAETGAAQPVRRKTPLTFKEMLFQVSERSRDSGPRTAACVMLGIDLADKPDARVASATGNMANVFLPADLKALLQQPEQFEARLHESYPAAFREYRKWSKADPVAYFGDALQPEGVAKIANPHRRHLQEALDGRKTLAENFVVVRTSPGHVARLAKPGKPMTLE